MRASLVTDSYGKQGVRLVKVTRHSDRHDISDMTVGISFEGDYETVHSQGDNARCLPTDTMKNTVYAVARQEAFREIEGLGLAIVKHFFSTTEHVARVRIDLAERRWNRLTVDGRPHSHAFARGSEEKHIAVITAGRESLPVVQSGIRELVVLKTTGSGFAGFLEDRFTTLKDADERIFATVVSATWHYESTSMDYEGVLNRVRQTILDTFAQHDSRSVQHTLYAMGTAVLEECAEIAEIALSLPNKHHNLFNLAPFSLDNPNEIFVPTDEPYGLIEGVLRRE